MFTVTETVRIDHPAADVFAFVVDARNRSQWDSTVVSERLTSPGPLTVGSTIRTRMRVMGREVDFDWLVTEFDAPARMKITSTSGMMPTTVTFDLPAPDAVTEVQATIEASPAGMMKVVEPMIAQAVRTNLGNGLKRVKEILEGREGS